MRICNDSHFFLHTNYMIYLIGIICGFINGLFSAAAGQILVFYLIFVLKIESHTSRSTSIFCMSIITCISLIGYIKMCKFKIYQMIIVIISGIVFGKLGSVVMQKIKSEYLNLVSGILITILTICNFIK